MDAPYCHRDFRRPTFTGPMDESIRTSVIKRGGAFHTFTHDQSPLDVIGWDGSVYPWAFPILNFQPRAGLGEINLPPVQTQLGAMAAQIATVESQLHGMEAAGHHVGQYYVPNRHFLYAAQVYSQDLYPKFINQIRELAGGGLIMLPSSAADLANPEVAAVLDNMQVSARDEEGAYERMKFLKLAWDAVGSEFASRHVQYEMFYAGAQFITQGHSFRTYDWERADGLLDRMLDGNDTEWKGPDA